MATIPVIVKHQGTRFDVELDPTSTGDTFKFQVYSLTGVEPDRQKILVKGGQLKDDTDLSTLKAKPGQVFMMVGNPSGQAIERPKETVKFMEDMTEAEAAKAEGAIPAGLQNLGNTCYLNSTLQTLKSVPELQDELAKYSSSSSQAGQRDMSQFTNLLGSTPRIDLVGSLGDLYKQMSETQQGFPPYTFLQALREAFPQFAQRSRTGQGFAQQDAEEAWSQIVSQLRTKLKIKNTKVVDGENITDSAAESSFVDHYLAGRFHSITECDEHSANEAGEETVESDDTFFKLDCHISKDTNHLTDGIKTALVEKIEKTSSVLGRESTYTKTSQISRLPKYLTVHFVRFFWKREAQKKAKIMRKVTFPQELDVVEFCTEALRKKLIPVRDKVREIRKDEEDISRARKRQKTAHKKEEEQAGETTKQFEVEPLQKSKEMKEEKEKKDKQPEESADTDMPDAVFKTDVEYDAERAAAVLAAKKELYELIDPELAKDEGANKSGIYELRGVVTHQGASADSGHYTSYVKKQGAIDQKTGERKEEDGKWWWFNDEKVSEVESEKIDLLSGGGESHSALILLYRAIDLPTAEELEGSRE